MSISLLRIFGVALFSASTLAHAEMPIEQATIKANRLYGALTGGLALLPTNPQRDLIISRIRDRNFLGAASIVTNADEFYNNVVAALPQTFNVDGSAVGPRNEMSAQFLVVARDNRPVSDLVMGDFTAYVKNGTPAAVKYAVDDTTCKIQSNTPEVANLNKLCNTQHFIETWATTNPRKSLEVIGHPEFPGVGIFTSYPWMHNYVRAGTGRRNIKGIMNNLYCVEMDAMRTNLIPDIRTRQDLPEDNPSYITDCQTCHTWMDDWVAPFLSMDFVKVRTENGTDFSAKWLSPVKDKLNEIKRERNAITSSSFFFFYTAQQDQILGIDESKLPVSTYAETGVKQIPGNDLRDLGKIVANSRGFYRCLVKRIVAQIYMGKHFSFSILNPSDFETLAAQNDTIETFTTHLMANKDLADIYRRIAVWYMVEE